MRRDKADEGWLWDMLDAAQSVADMVRGMTFHEYCNDRRTRRAVEREIEIIGEAARNLSPGYKVAHPVLPWDKIVGMRHRLAHEYGEIQDEILWRVATGHIPEIIGCLRPLVPEAPLEEDEP